MSYDWRAGRVHRRPVRSAAAKRPGNFRSSVTREGGSIAIHRPFKANGDGPEWRLTVCSAGGLANRLKVLTSGLALAEATGRAFRMLWPLHANCTVPFATLFTNGWDVVDIGQRELDALPREVDWRARPLPDVLAARSPHVIARYNSWLIRPAAYPAHEPLRARCAELLERLEPSPDVRERIERFHREHLRPEMIGVHLRRGDMLRVRPDVAGNTAAAIAQVEAFLAERPTAGILLCTDDGAGDPVMENVPHEGVREVFQARFGDRLVCPRPHSLGRASPDAIHDAAVDFFLLRGTQMFVGSRGSTFSDLAVFGRRVPAVFCAAPLPGYLRFERVTKATGLYYLVKAVGRLRYGRGIPFAKLWMWLIGKRLPRRYQFPGVHP